MHLPILSYKERVLLYIIRGVRYLNGKNFIQGLFPNKLTPHAYRESMSFPNWSDTFITQWGQLVGAYSDQLPESLLESRRVKGLREGAQLAICAYINDSWPIIQCAEIPSPWKLLEYQANGQRVISLMDHLDFETKVTEDKSAFEFMVHDFEHAAKFFKCPDSYKEQVVFFKWVQNLSKEHWVKDLLNRDDQFKKDWHYLISDMNTSPTHAKMFMNAIVLNACKRKSNTPLQKRLSPESEEFFNFCKSQIDLCPL